MRRLLVLLPLLIATAAVGWAGLNLPPPFWLVKYGLPPGCEPTGEVVPAEGVELVVIGPGCFRMGSTENGKPGSLVGRFSDPIGIEWGESPEPSNEMPVHWVEFPEGFGIAKTEVTNAQFERFDPRHRRGRASAGDADPVVNVSWEEARKYCEWLSKETGRRVRLPSEAEWEAACRGGRVSEYVSGADESGLGAYAWYLANAELQAQGVATKSANPWGLYDLTGNVWEWCEDSWHEAYIVVRTGRDPSGLPIAKTVRTAPTDGSAWVEAGWPSRVHRGGAWSYSAWCCRSASRNSTAPSDYGMYLGFRPALTMPSDPRTGPKAPR